MDDPTPPVTPRAQQLSILEPPCRTNRSVDSGYGSLETSPTRPGLERRLDRKSLSLTARLEGLSLNSYDGNSSEESDSDISCQGDWGPQDSSSARTVRERFATLPKASRRRISRTDSYPVLLEHKTAHYRNGSDDTGICGSRVSSLRALDRFVPMRDHATPGSSKLRTTRALEELTPSERLVRHNQDAPDPFFFKRRALPPSPSEARKARRPSQSRTLLDLAASNHLDRRVVSFLTRAS